MIDELFGLSGKTALITGGGSGIGAMMVHGFAHAGAHVIICSRKLHQVKETAAQVNGTNPSGSVEAFSGDGRTMTDLFVVGLAHFLSVAQANNSAFGM